MPSPKDRTSKPKELKRIGDYVTIAAGERLEGDKVDIEDILGVDIVLKDFVFIESTKFQDEKNPDGTPKKGEFAVLQFSKVGEDKVLTTACGGKVVVRALKEMPKQ